MKPLLRTFYSKTDLFQVLFYTTIVEENYGFKLFNRVFWSLIPVAVSQDLINNLRWEVVFVVLVFQVQVNTMLDNKTRIKP